MADTPNHQMQILRYKVQFLTPAFLGNAEQSGQWRTPPFKALLRQWWRIAVARQVGFDHTALRRQEGLLFGHAWLDGDVNTKENAVHARASKVRLRLERWSHGKETRRTWGQQELAPQHWKVRHPEVDRNIGPLLYLGYGPLTTENVRRQGRNTSPKVLKQNAAIQSGETTTLAVAVPGHDGVAVRAAFSLMNAYGALGGRSRNGWGSATFTPTAGTPETSVSLDQFQEPLDDALNRYWPHSIGCDDKGPLIWQTKRAYNNWKDLMRDLAVLKIDLRTKFSLAGAQPPHRRPLDRHWLSYPITRHQVKNWKNKRLPNSLRFKVRADEHASSKKLRGVIFHVPCLPPREFQSDLHRRQIEAVWRKVHAMLDRSRKVELRRIPE